MAGTKVSKYGVQWDATTLPLSRELTCITNGGRWKKKNGTFAGNGNAYHYKAAVQILWPEIIWHRWMDLLLEQWLSHRIVGVMGPTNSSKSCSMALFHLVDYYAFSSCTTILLCSTTLERLEDRIWGEMKKWHKLAKRKFTWLPGQLIEGRKRLVTDHRQEAAEGRDFRNGIICVACKPGATYTGLGEFIGIKNKRVRLCGDELQLLPPAFVDVIPNLIKNADCRITGMGNPKETLDALGRICEPAVSAGGWDGGIDQTPKTKTWPTRWPDGVCIQLSGSDSPNTDVPEDAPVPFPFLITRKQMADDATTWGKDDWHFTMFNEGRMPRGQGSRRVLTRRLCEVGHAFDDPRWNDNHSIVDVTFLDAAYRAVGGDRCVFGHLRFGYEAPADLPAAMVEALIDQNWKDRHLRQILHLVELKIIPITGGLMATVGEPEEQIVRYVKAENERLKVEASHFFYDSGMRTSLVQCFSRNYSNQVNSIDCGGKPTDRKVSQAIDVPCSEYYSKFITELWYSVRMIVEAGQFRGLTQDAMWEGCAREWKMASGNRIEVESKGDMKAKTGRSPDLFDALAIGCEGARRLGFKIASLREKEDAARNDAWRRELRERAQKLQQTGQLTYQ